MSIIRNAVIRYLHGTGDGEIVKCVWTRGKWGFECGTHRSDQVELGTAKVGFLIIIYFAVRKLTYTDMPSHAHIISVMSSRQQRKSESTSLNKHSLVWKRF